MTMLAAAEQAALQLLGNTANDPTPRSKRIASIYAGCHLDEPLLGSWFGLASYVARHVHYALASPTGPWRTMMGDGNYKIYMGIVPSWLLYRAGRPVSGPLSTAFNQTQRADAAMRRRPMDPNASALAEEALLTMCDVEQRVILQPTYDVLNPILRPPLDVLFSFRLGLAPSSPVLAWDTAYGHPWNAADRCRWMNAVVLPAWQVAQAQQGHVVRAEVDRTRRWGEFTLDALNAAVDGLR